MPCSRTCTSHHEIEDLAPLPLDVQITCIHRFSMPTMIQIRDVPDTLHCQLKSRAALAGMSHSAYLLDEIRQIASRPTLEELRARIAQRSKVDPRLPPAEAVRAERDRS